VLELLIVATSLAAASLCRREQAPSKYFVFGYNSTLVLPAFNQILRSSIGRDPSSVFTGILNSRDAVSASVFWRGAGAGQNNQAVAVPAFTVPSRFP
jgi:hypothetical protein